MKTVTVKTAELESAALDWAVAKALGWTVRISIRYGVQCVNIPDEWNTETIIEFSPHTDWQQAGPLITDKITVIVDSEDVCYADCGAKAHAIKYQKPLDEYDGSGKTILIACMRA